MVNIPKVDNCCFVVPLRIGAFLVAAWMFIWNLYGGIALFILPFGGTYGIILKIVAVPYLLIAIASFLGAKAIYEEDAVRTQLFSKIYLASIAVYLLLQIAVIILSYVAAASAVSAANAIVNDSVAQCKANQKDLPASARNDALCNQIGNTASTVSSAVGFSIVSYIIPFLVALIVDAYLYVVIRSYAIELTEKSRGNKPQI
jgi:hypothetical protein